MFKSTTLDAIGIKHGTDKCSSSDAQHDYLRKYEFFLRPLRNKSFTFLELGVYKGASLRTWAEFFPKAEVIGVDIEPAAAELAGKDAKVIIGNLAQNEFLTSLKDLKPFVVLDDASHWWPDQLRAFFTLYPSLPSGGLYIMEDIHTSFEPLARHFASGFDTPPFTILVKLAEYMTGNDRPSPIVANQNLVPIAREKRFDSELRLLADLTDAVIFIERACLMVRK
ncbi:MAG: class I SAM-dependent methyltransferase [Deltaproteobacteria bacterium]|jgi:hypothetical protein|nr:class I SAM-dependent methyltransferase [Deltaproteobacteria bacterium]